MRVLQINSVNYGSTGNIMFALADELACRGNTVLCASGFTWKKNCRSDHIMIGNFFTKSFHMLMARMFGKHGWYSYSSTKKFLKKVQAFRPDIIHLHNIHGWYLNLPILFEFLKQSDIPVVWTLHDCWPFTGGCAHFTYHSCERWKKGCKKCRNLKEYPIASHRDCTQKMWTFKKDHISELNHLTVVTPSYWLAELVGYSFLKRCAIKVIHNGIDLSVFSPSEGEFRKRNHLEGKYIVLGVSYGWSMKKGLDIFIELSKSLPKDRYQIVLVGTDEETEHRLPHDIISIRRTQNQKELADIYTAADVFVNPTREDNYPTVNMEAIACGTPTITFHTGGSPEMIDESCGVIAEDNDLETVEREIKRICETKPFSKEECIKKAKEFDKNERFKEYIKLYEKIIAQRNPTDGNGTVKEAKEVL